MKIQKLNFGNIKNKLSRAEMKNIMAGSGFQYPPGGGQCTNMGASCVSYATCGGCPCLPSTSGGMECA